MIYIEMDGHKYISEVDYLKVVEEKERHLKDLKEKDEVINKLFVKKEHYKDYIKCLEKEKEELKEKELRKELEEKDKEIRKENENYLKMNKELNVCYEIIKQKDEVINHYKNKWNNAVMMGDKIIKEKDEVIEELKRKNEYYAKEYERLKERIEKADSRVESYEEWYNNNVYEFNKMKEENERLKNLYEPEPQYEEWCELKYYYETNEGKSKTYTQEMLLEDAYELIGMDSDNWLGFVVMKFKKEVK